MMAPRVHLNGTSGEALLDENRKARDAVAVAFALLAHGGPNARDYYVIGTDAFRQARDEHRDRLRQLRIVLDELDDVGMQIADQLKGRTR